MQGLSIRTTVPEYHVVGSKNLRTAVSVASFATLATCWKTLLASLFHSRSRFPRDMQLLYLAVIVWFVALHPVLGLRNALSSLTPLRCCFMEEPPISFHNPRSNWNNGLDGVISNYLLQHQSYLNWTCSTLPPFRTDFNAFVTSMFACTNKSTGQIIDSEHCVCDIGIGGWFQNPSRFGKVDFLPPFVYDRYVVFTHVSQATVAGKVWFFIQTFDKTSWICIVALFAMFAFLKLLDKGFDPPAPYSHLPRTSSTLERYVHYLTKSHVLHRLRKAIQSTMTRMLMLSDEPVVRSGTATRQWFLNLILAVCSLFLILSYEASMTASLVQESIETAFHSTEDLQNCRIDPSDVCMLKGGALETHWKNSIATDECHVQNPPTFFTSYKALFEAVEHGACKYGIIIESVVTAAIRGRYCGRFVVVGDPVSNGGLSMLLPIGSNLSAPMSLATLEFVGNQSAPTLNKYLSTLPQCEAEVHTMLTFAKLHVFFAITFSFGAIIFLSMVLIPQQISGDSQSKEASAPSGNQSLEAKRSCTETASTWSTDDGREEAPL